MKQLAKSDGYKELVKKIQSKLTKLDFFIRRCTAEVYWKVGKFIHKHILKHQNRVNYGRHIFESLADEAERDASTLSKMFRFYRPYPILDARPKLN